MHRSEKLFQQWDSEAVRQQKRVPGESRNPPLRGHERLKKWVPDFRRDAVILLTVSTVSW